MVIILSLHLLELVTPDPLVPRHKVKKVIPVYGPQGNKGETGACCTRPHGDTGPVGPQGLQRYWCQNPMSA